MRKVPFKNYVFALIILIITVVVAYDIVDKFKNNNQSTKNTVLTEIRENEIDDYVTERTEVVIYISSNKKDEEINKSVGEYFKKHNLSDKAVYLDSDELSNDFVKSFSEKYKSNIEINYPVVIVIEDNIITKMIRVTDSNKVDELLNNIGDIQ